MGNPYEHYFKLSEHEIERRLAAKRMPDAMRVQLKETIMQGKAEYKSAQAREKQTKRLWFELLAPLKYELKMVNIMLKKTQQQVANGYYANEAEGVARVRALEEYADVMNRLDTKCHKRRHEGLTPKGVAQERTKIFPSGMPNNGTHWVDFVPTSVKEYIAGLFDAIPHRAKAKRKIPFERRVPMRTRQDHGETLSVWHEQQFTLKKRTEKDLERLIPLARVNPDKYEAQVEQVRQALEWIDNLEEGEALPTTWHGFYK